MKKFLIFIMIILAAFSAGCDVLLDTLEEYAEEQSEEADLKTAAPSNDGNSQADSQVDVSGLYDNMPSLPDMDFENSDLFEDGYQVVEFDHAPDGDTAIFVVGSSYLKTRFLGVDTTEMSTDSGTPEPWAQQGKEFTNYMLENADEIILELDDNADDFDDYDRLLAWIWVDGQLLNYMLAARGFADVRYLYDDYKYNDDLLDAEYMAQNQELGIWGDDEPYYNPNENYTASVEADDDYISIKDARNLSEGADVKVKGVVTNKIENNAFIEDSTGGIYVYTNNKKFSALEIGSEVIIEGELSDYNGFLEIVNFTGSDIRIVSDGNDIFPENISLNQVGEDMESQYVSVENAEIVFVEYTKGQNGYSIFITKDGFDSEVRIDKHLSSYPDPESFAEGDLINVVGNISQHYDAYQIMISNEDAVSIQ